MSLQARSSSAVCSNTEGSDDFTRGTLASAQGITWKLAGLAIHDLSAIWVEDLPGHVR
jgi:hypothetical protein